MPVNDVFTAENLERALLRTVSPKISHQSPKPPQPSLSGASAKVILPPTLSSALPLSTTLHRRIAVRQFARRPISLAHLSTVLAASELQSALPAAGDCSAAPSLYVHAWKVQKVTPAYYLYEPEAHSLAFRSRVPPSADIPAMFRQIEFASSAAMLVIVGGLDDSLTRLGNHGYRLLLLAAGTALHRCWLAAVSVGLAGCVCEAPFQRANGHPLYPLPEGQIPLLALALGEASDGGPDDGGSEE
jgi:nitroreductase